MLQITLFSRGRVAALAKSSGRYGARCGRQRYGRGASLSPTARMTMRSLVAPKFTR
jgi:hypothetical protein